MRDISKNNYVRFASIFLAFLFIATLLHSTGSTPASEFNLFLRAFDTGSDSLITNVGVVKYSRNNQSITSTASSWVFGFPARKVIAFNDGGVPIFINCDTVVTSGATEIIIPSKIAIEYPYQCSTLYAITGAGGASTLHFVAWR